MLTGLTVAAANLTTMRSPEDKDPEPLILGQKDLQQVRWEHLERKTNVIKPKHTLGDDVISDRDPKAPWEKRTEVTTEVRSLVSPQGGEAARSKHS